MFGPKQRARRLDGQRPRSRSIAVSGRDLPLTIREDRRSKRITLRIEPGGRALRLSVPTGLPEDDIERFLRRNHGWLSARIDGLPKPNVVEDGGVIPIRDLPHRIRRTGKARGITATDEIDGENVLLVGGAPQHLKRRVADYLKKQADEDLRSAVARHAAHLGRQATAIRLKDTRSRWGSCSSDGRLSFSWRIVMAPSFVLDYLAAHEVAHLREMNHGPRFWSLCRTLCSRTDDAKSWLKKNGSALHAIDFREAAAG